MEDCPENEISDNEDEDYSYDNVVDVSVEDLMGDAGMAYATATLKSRAIPDSRDGLLPIYRRILYSMHMLGLKSTGPFKKCARIEGDTIGKYHPHGGAYSSLVNLSQQWNKNHILIDFQGSKGDIDGDKAAAMRYTEARFTPFGESFLTNINKRNVPFVDNYDATLEEPKVLPVTIPISLINGVFGIAVGFSAKSISYNLNEAVDSTIALIKNPELTIEELMLILKGPDLPLPGLLEIENYAEILRTGKGNVQFVAPYILDEEKRTIEFTSIPIATGKIKLVTDIIESIEKGQINNITGFNDYSSMDKKTGTYNFKLIFTYAKDENPHIIIGNIYKYTSLSSKIPIRSIFIQNEQLKMLGALDLLNDFITFRKETLLNEFNFDRDKLLAKLHLMSGIMIALNDIDKTLSIVKTSKGSANARERLIEHYPIDEVQAQAIVDTKLYKITEEEIVHIKEESFKVIEEAKHLQNLIEEPHLLNEYMIDQLLASKKALGRERLSTISHKLTDYSKEFVSDEEVVVVLSKNGYIFKEDLRQYRLQSRGGKGRQFNKFKEGDEVKCITKVRNNEELIICYSSGIVRSLPANRLTSKAKSMNVYFNETKEDEIATIIQRSDEGNIFFLTAKGRGMKISLSKFLNIPRNGRPMKAISINEGDKLIAVVKDVNNDEGYFVSITKKGMAVKVKSDTIRTFVSRAGTGVNHHSLNEGDEIFALESIHVDESVYLLMDNGLGKNFNESQLRLTSRGAKGVNTIKAGSDAEIIALFRESLAEQVIFISEQGKVFQTSLSSLNPKKGKRGIGNIVMRLDEGDKVINATPIERDEEDQKSGLALTKYKKNEIWRNCYEQK
ncbi:MAG: hypothetical protein HOG49_33370 [Candidatus Scalindua sp.]|nr:hypothetical protein [Candidatus Scalindua sp.]